MKPKWVGAAASCALISGLALGAAGCTPATDGAGEAVFGVGQSLIAGVSGSDASLNAVGTLSFLHPADDEKNPGLVELICSASLVAERTVLTAKHCVDLLLMAGDYGYSPVFTLGPDGRNPLRTIEVVDFRTAPGDVGGYVGMGHDVAVLFLAEPVTDVQPLVLSSVKDEDVGTVFAGAAFGQLDFGESTAKRRVGQLTLRAKAGRTYEHLFGSFAAYYEWYWGQALPVSCNPEAGRVIEVMEIAPVPIAGEGAAGAVEAPQEMQEVVQEELQEELQEDCSIADALWQEYNKARLENVGELLAGGFEGDAQPCFGDSGSPLLRKQDGRLTAFGVVSGGISSRYQECDYGAIFAGLGPEMLQFIEEAQAWVDPCEGLTAAGLCDGPVATRCTHALEGARRALRMDCTTVGLACMLQADGAVGCGMDDPGFAAPPAANRSGEMVDLTAAETRAFRAPAGMVSE